MRLLLSAVAMGLMAGSAFAGEAGSKTMGYAELGAGWQTTNWDMPALYSFALGGAVNIPMAERFNLEFEARGSAVNGTGGQYAQAGLFAHAFWRDSQTFAVGAFGGYAPLELYGGQHGGMLAGGAEVQAYFGNLTLYGQAAAIKSSVASTASSWLFFDGYFARGAARYYVTPGTRLQFDAQWTAMTSTADTTNTLTLIGSVEHQFANAPFAGFANVRWDHMTHGANKDIDATAVTFGIRAYFGGSSMENDRGGATMDVLPMPILLGLNFG